MRASRFLIPTVILAAATASVLWTFDGVGVAGERAAGDAPSANVAGGMVTPGNAVYLDDAALAKLRVSNPNHYARALKVIDAANEFCKPGPAELTYAKANAQSVSCTRMLLWTSNPPKREITFRLDNTRYIALVKMTDDPPRLVNAN